MRGYDYNVILTAFYITYITCEIPSLVVCKRMGPGWFLPVASVLFGICSVATAFVRTVLQACFVRALLGIFEAGMLPGIAYYLSRWYTRAELTFRLSLYIVTAPLAGAFGGMLASGILTLDSFGGLASWRMIFAVEGIITIGISLAAMVLLTDRPETARWLSASEKALAVARVKSERETCSAVLDKMNTKKYLKGIMNPVTMSVAFVFLFDAVTVQALAFFLPTVVKNIFPDASTVRQQLYTVPPYLVGSFFAVLLPFLSWRLDHRQGFFLFPAVMVMTAYSMFVASQDRQVRYAATFLASTAFSLGPMTNAQVSANVVSDTARNAALAANGMFAAVGGLVGVWSFLPWDAPNYLIGNGLNLGTSSSTLVLSLATLVWMRWDNKRRERAEAEPGTKERLQHLTSEETEDLDWRHPAFRWKL